MGVMKAVGEAVAEGQKYNFKDFQMTHTLRCIGIAPWGYVENNHKLLRQEDVRLKVVFTSELNCWHLLV